MTYRITDQLLCHQAKRKRHYEFRWKFLFREAKDLTFRLMELTPAFMSNIFLFMGKTKIKPEGDLPKNFKHQG